MYISNSIVVTYTYYIVKKKLYFKYFFFKNTRAIRLIIGRAQTNLCKRKHRANRGTGACPFTREPPFGQRLEKHTHNHVPLSMQCENNCVKVKTRLLLACDIFSCSSDLNTPSGDCLLLKINITNIICNMFTRVSVICLPLSEFDE